MKMERIGERLEGYQHSYGDIMWITGETRPILEDVGNDEALGRLEVTEDKVKSGIRVNLKWKQNDKKDPLERVGTREKDGEIDRTLSLVLKTAEPFTNLKEDVPLKEKATEFIEEFFPEGVYPITSQSHQDQHEDVGVLIEDWRSNEWADHIDALNLGPLVDQLELLHAEFDKLLSINSEGVSYKKVQKAYAEAEDAFHKLLIKLIHDYMDDIGMLNKVLQPYFIQEERTRRIKQHGGDVPGVDDDIELPGGDGTIVEPEDDADVDAGEDADSSDEEVVEPV